MGFPVTVIVTAALQDLQAGAGHAVTAGGTLVPMTDLIRLATPAYNYLAVFDKVTGKALWLGRKKRLASAEQRIMLLAQGPWLHRRPGAPSAATTARSITPPQTGSTAATPTSTTSRWPANATTCTPRTTAGTPRKLPNGHTEWIPPPGVPLIGGVNTYHHPERLPAQGGGRPLSQPRKPGPRLRR